MGRWSRICRGRRQGPGEARDRDDRVDIAHHLSAATINDPRRPNIFLSSPALLGWSPKPRRRARGNDRLVRPNARSGTRVSARLGRSQRWRREAIAPCSCPRRPAASHNLGRCGAVAVRNAGLPHGSLIQEHHHERGYWRALGGTPPGISSTFRHKPLRSSAGDTEGAFYFENGQLVQVRRSEHVSCGLRSTGNKMCALLDRGTYPGLRPRGRARSTSIMSSGSSCGATQARRLMEFCRRYRPFAAVRRDLSCHAGSFSLPSAACIALIDGQPSYGTGSQDVPELEPHAQAQHVKSPQRITSFRRGVGHQAHVESRRLAGALRRLKRLGALHLCATMPLERPPASPPATSTHISRPSRATRER